MSHLIGRMTPRMVKRGVGRVRAEGVRAKVLGDLRRIARSGRPVIAGPWLGEVGFEILYWVPFLRWALARVQIDPSRVVAVSRGGPASWYTGLADRYVDVFDVMPLATYRDGNEVRRRIVGEQKQLHTTPFDDDIARRAADYAGVAHAEVLHPSLMYRLMRPFWWKHASERWVFRHARPARLTPSAPPPALALPRGSYIATKFYFNDCLEPSPDVRKKCAAVIDALGRRLPVVSLNADIQIDDHAGETHAAVQTLAGHVSVRDNLDVQTAVMANARAFVGTYGGFSYLAPLTGVPARALYSVENGFDRAHLHIARSTIARIDGPSYELGDLMTVDPDAFADEVVSL